MTGILYKNRLGNILPTREFDNWFGNLFGDGLPVRPTFRAPVAIWEAENGYHIDVDLPGVQKDAIELSFEQGNLQIVAERAAPEGDRTDWHDERIYGRVTRTVSLPETIDADATDARLADGVLHVVVPKKPEAKPKQIEVKAT